MKILPLIAVIFDLLFLVQMAFISGHIYPVNNFELFLLMKNLEMDLWPTNLLPFLPILLLLINIFFKIKTRYIGITIILIIINLLLYIKFESCLRPY